MADDKESARGNGTKPKKAPTFAKVPISLVSDQTFDDNESRKDPHLAKIFHGTLAEHTEALVQKNHQHRRGMSAAAIEAALLAENTMRCDPALSELSRLAEVMKGSRPTMTLESKQGGRRHG